jgi:hypothetical protein
MARKAGVSAKISNTLSNHEMVLSLISQILAKYVKKAAHVKHDTP